MIIELFVGHLTDQLSNLNRFPLDNGVLHPQGLVDLSIKLLFCVTLVCFAFFLILLKCCKSGSVF